VAGAVQDQGAGAEFYELRVKAGDGHEVPGQGRQDEEGRGEAPRPAG
jgi:hypothetical protein